MNKEWPTQEKDMFVALRIIQEYADVSDCESIGLFELIFDEQKKRMSFRLSTWVKLLAEHFKDKYGADQGDFVTRQVISKYMTQGQTVH